MALDNLVKESTRCIDCEKTISNDRLEHLTFAKRCFDCQSLREVWGNTGQEVKMLSKEEIKQIFLDSGFKIKAGESDLKSYVYDAAHALLKQYIARQNKTK